MSQDRGDRLTELAVGWETHPWETTSSEPASRRQRLAARGPYRSALPPTIAHRAIPIDAGLAAEAEDAVREITRFDAEISAMTARTGAAQTGDPPEIAPLASVLLRTESASSSEIEGITAGAKALALAAIHESSGPNAVLVTANVGAMRTAIALSDDIGIESLLAAHRALLDGHAYAAPGRLRDRQVWIGSSAISPHTASFVPPHHARVPGLMTDLVDFVARTDLPVLTHVAIAHAQLETIHPFNDGNGRIGRTLVHAMLRHAGVTRRITLPISAGLLADTSSYFAALTAYREGEIAPMVEQFVAASFRAVTNGRELVSDLEATHEAWSARLGARRGSAARRMLPVLLNQPAVSVRIAMDAIGVTETAAQRALDQLEDARIVSRANTNRRNRIWLATDVLDDLDRFAERVGRRG